jgi:hypothetical protein
VRNTQSEIPNRQVDRFDNRQLLEPVGVMPSVEYEAMYYEDWESPVKEAGLN